jgi:hypothetical protein
VQRFELCGANEANFVLGCAGGGGGCESACLYTLLLNLENVGV